MAQRYLGPRSGSLLVATALVVLLGADANAKDPGADAYMIRVLSCQGADAAMELYLPQSLVLKGDQAVRKMRPTIGYYVLDLSSAQKGKVLEPVRVSMAADGKTITVDQYTRGLPPTRIPVGGGTVDFDQRFGTQAKCGAFNQRNE